MTEFRTFRNADPPLIADLWRRSTDTRGFGKLAGSENLELALFSKLYFDPKGLILAFDGKTPIGMCHAGFGSDESQQHLDTSMGVVCMLMVDPHYRRRGIGSELFQRAREYLRGGGAQVIYAGALHPLNPFYLGLYGGSEMPGVLESDVPMTRFVFKHGFVPADTCLVFHLLVEEMEQMPDARIPLLRRQVKLTVESWPSSLSWWQACTMGWAPTLRYDMLDRSTEEPIGSALVWEMETHGRAWRIPSVGVTHVHIAESRRRSGYGVLLLHSIIKHLQDQNIGLVEIQTMLRNAAARNLYGKLGFRQVDRGHVYRESVPSSRGALPEAHEANASMQDDTVVNLEIK